MTIREIPNINNCNIEEFGNPVSAYRITANDGWCIHMEGHDDNEYTRVIIIGANDPAISTIEILEIATLPEGSEIHGGNDNDAEIMSDTEQTENDTGYSIH